MSPSSATLRPLSIGEILDGAFTLYRRHFVTIAATSAIVHVPLILLGIADAPFLLIWWASVFIGVTASMATSWLYSELILGRRPSVRDGIARCLERFFPAIGAWFVSFVLIVLGMLLFIVPGIALAIRYFAVVQTSVIEASPHPLKRSATLAVGSASKIAGVWFLAFLITFIPGFVLGVANGIATPRGGVVSRLLTFAMTLLLGPFNSGVMTLLYYDQRVRKEGLDVTLAAAEIAAVAQPTAPPRA